MEKSRFMIMNLVLCLVALSKAIESPQYTAVHKESDMEIRLYRVSAWMSAPAKQISFEKATKDGFHSMAFDRLGCLNSACPDEKCGASIKVLKSISGGCSLEGFLVSGGNHQNWTIWVQHEEPMVMAAGLENRKLFQYIQGANLNWSRISMTVPVLTSIVPEAGPLHSSAYFVSLYLPFKFQSNPPVPLPELNLQPDSWPSRCIAVRKFSGFLQRTIILSKRQRSSPSV
ncbi:hypothetical protein Acr_19g0007700 [Actinidia rufa]|uniref:Uncharacterized protein n=1 Tax=Actinidia rufa TaxID=165716 RepID=A0A7J0GAN1_9ERIC|nr:hypothetical protein Acr_19g0007700 [Actinidia rufa]